MLLDNRRKKLFDNAYSAYLTIVKTLKDIIQNAEDDPFNEDHPSLTDTICDLDLFLQGFLLEIAVSDGRVSDEEIEFIISLPDEYDEICRRYKGYRSFIKNVSVESYRELRSRYFNETSAPVFLTLVKEESSSELEDVIKAIEIIWNSFAAIDDVVSESKNTVISQSLLTLKNYVYPSKRSQEADDRSQFGTETVPSNHNDQEHDKCDDVLAELDALVGLENVKQEVHACINLIKINNMRKDRGLPELQTSKHMVFAGQPGTGKTTVARILASVYKELGVVSKGQLVETDRAGMVAGYVGQTALKTAQVIKKARGGVLFIDEAYSLNSLDGSNDFGKEAIDTLVKGMEDYRDDLIVIVAGYTDQMKQFIDMNPGLRSRFNKYIYFNNYSGAELFSIFQGLCNQAKYILTKEAKEKARIFLEGKKNNDEFGNARGVRNYFDRMATRQATRIVSIKNPSDTDIRTVTEVDLD